MEQSLIIETGKSLRYENVASYRKKMNESEISIEMGKFVNFIKQSGAQKNGPMITATFGIEETNFGKIIDMEFLVPIDREIEMQNQYVFKPIFHLMNAIYTRYVGNPIGLQKVYSSLIGYIQRNQLQQITVAYNVNVNDEKVSLDQSIIDVYVAINPNTI